MVLRTQTTTMSGNELVFKDCSALVTEPSTVSRVEKLEAGLIFP